MSARHVSAAGAYVSAAEAARMMGLDIRTIVRWVKCGVLKGRSNEYEVNARGKREVRYFVLRSSIEAWKKGG